MKYTLAIAALLAVTSARHPHHSNNLMTISEALKKIETHHVKKTHKVAKKAKAAAAEHSASGEDEEEHKDHKHEDHKEEHKDHKKAAHAQESEGDDEEENKDHKHEDHKADHKDHKHAAHAQESGEDDEEVQINANAGGDSEEEDHSKEFFKSGEHDMLGDGGYKRVTTTRFAADDDDIFMRSMIEQYALEGKNKDGSPNGQFFMDEANARAASHEVLDTHRHLTGKAREEYLKAYFPRTWAHFDVNRTGKVEAIKMPQLIRFLCSDQQMYLW
jgi:hypothetical protein